MFDVVIAEPIAVQEKAVTALEVQTAYQQQKSDKRLKPEYIKAILEARKGINVRDGLASFDDE